MSEANKPGDLRVWWVPQVPHATFYVAVASVKEGVKITDVLAEYDLFQFKNKIKPDYCNAGGLQVYEADGGEGAPDWSDWYDHDTGEDDPRAWLESQANQQPAEQAKRDLRKGKR